MVSLLGHADRETSGPRSPIVGRLGSGRDGQALRTTGLFRTGVGRVLGCGPRIWCSGSMCSRADDGATSGVLCRRHADSMVVPPLLDPRRFARPRSPPLPTSASALPPPAPVPRRRSQPTGSASEQLLLLTDVVAAAPEGEATDADAAVPWTPTFDEHDDLDGLLSARSPLLARAFRGGGRPRPS